MNQEGQSPTGSNVVSLHLNDDATQCAVVTSREDPSSANRHFVVMLDGNLVRVFEKRPPKKDGEHAEIYFDPEPRVVVPVSALNVGNPLAMLRDISDSDVALAAVQAWRSFKLSRETGRVAVATPGKWEPEPCPPGTLYREALCRALGIPVPSTPPSSEEARDLSRQARLIREKAEHVDIFVSAFDAVGKATGVTFAEVEDNRALGRWLGNTLEVIDGLQRERGLTGQPTRSALREQEWRAWSRMMLKIPGEQHTTGQELRAGVDAVIEKGEGELRAWHTWARQLAGPGHSGNGGLRRAVEKRCKDSERVALATVASTKRIAEALGIELPQAAPVDVIVDRAKELRGLEGYSKATDEAFVAFQDRVQGAIRTFDDGQVPAWVDNPDERIVTDWDLSAILGDLLQRYVSNRDRSRDRQGRRRACALPDRRPRDRQRHRASRDARKAHRAARRVRNRLAQVGRRSVSTARQAGDGEG